MTDQIHGDVFHFEDLLPELQYEIVKRMSPVEQIKFERTSQNSKELVKSSFLRTKYLHIDNMPSNSPSDENKEANIELAIRILRKFSTKLEYFKFNLWVTTKKR